MFGSRTNFNQPHPINHSFKHTISGTIISRARTVVQWPVFPFSFLLRMRLEVTLAHTPMSHTCRASAWGLMAHILFYQWASFSSITVIDLGRNKSLEISIQTSIIFNFDVTQLHRRTNDHSYHQNIQTNCDLAT